VIRVESAAIRGCPVDTGRLRASITHEIASDVEGLVGRVGTDVEYAPYVEFGTGRMAAQPYLRPALGAGQ
jgi:HK97 gp10 family phage protein